MRTLPSGLQAHLDSGTTTLCWCWRVTRRDGTRFGFTDHDRDITFDGTIFEAATGFTASEIKDQVGLSVDNLEVTSALVSERITETALAAGDFDDAAVEIFRLNWQDPAQRVRMRTGSIGEVRRTGTTFIAEVRGLAHYLQQPKGRVYQYGCDAEVGDARCGIDLTVATYRGDGIVAAAASSRTFTATGLASFAAGVFTRGLATFASGANAGRAMEVKSHSVSAALATVELWQPLPAPIEVGHMFTITAGCDRQLATCHAKFANAVNFRGFPHMPGNDFVASYPRADHPASGP